MNNNNSHIYSQLMCECGFFLLGHHKVNGHFGALIIREPFETDPNSLLYDYDFPEHTVLAADWMHELAETLMPGLRSSGGILPVNLLINGQGRYQNVC